MRALEIITGHVIYNPAYMYLQIPTENQPSLCRKIFVKYILLSHFFQLLTQRNCDKAFDKNLSSTAKRILERLEYRLHHRLLKFDRSVFLIFKPISYFFGVYMAWFFI